MTLEPVLFAKLPRDYPALCRMHLPRPIHDEAEYENLAEVAFSFAGFEDSMNEDQRDYFDLITSLMETWEHSTVEIPPVSGMTMLKHLLEEHSLNGANLSRLLGASPKLGSMIVRGERSITAEHARTLGRHFGLPAGTFIE